MMIPTYRYSLSSSSTSPMPLDLNEEQDYHHHFFSSNYNLHQPSSSSNNNSSLSYSLLFHPDHDQPGSCYRGSKLSQSDDHEEGERVVPTSGSWGYSEADKKDGNNIDQKVWKKEEGNNFEKFQGEEDNLVKWMPSKKRMIRRMMVWDQTGITNKQNKYDEEPKLPLSSPLGNGNSSNNSSSQNNITVRVCSDCHTTKTPLWRSGPRGPKSLCNACGIRQRKARRAMAAAASADGAVPETREKPHHFKGKKKLKSEESELPKLKKKRKLIGAKPSNLVGNNNNKKRLSFEDLTISLSKNLALQQVFPQDEKEAAILLMALSHGLLHGFPSYHYLDL